MIEVTLNVAEQKLARFLARARYEKNRKSGTPDLKMGPQSCEETDLEGIGAEIAFAKAHNCYPDLSTDHRPDADVLLGDGRTVDVKATKYPSGHLLAMRTKRGKSVDVFALMVGAFPTYRLAGVMTYEELINDQRLKDFGYGPVFAASQESLCPAP